MIDTKIKILFYFFFLEFSFVDIFDYMKFI